jgi:hypothetical protein
MSLHGWCFFFRNPIFSIFCAFRVYFLHLSGKFSEQCICTVPWNVQEIFWVRHWAVLNIGQNNFILHVFVYLCRIFFACICGARRTLFWLSAHTKVICNISLDRLRTVYSLFYLSDDFQILFEFKTFRTTIIFKNNLFYIDFYLGKYSIS